MIPKRESLKRNIVTAAASYLVTLLAAFVTFPVFFRHLGSERYGVWILALEFTSYCTYVDLGIRSALTYFVARFWARNEHDRVDEIASTAFWTAVACGACVCLGGVGLAYLFSSLFKISPEVLPSAQRMIVILACETGLFLPIDCINSLLNGKKRLDAANLNLVAMRGANAVTALICVTHGFGLVGLSAIQLGSRILHLALTYMAFRRLLPELQLTPRLWRVSSLRKLISFGVPSVLIRFAQMLSGRMDLVIVGMFVGVPMVVYYAIPRSILEYTYLAIRSLTGAFTAPLTHLHAGHDKQETIKLYLKGARLCGLCSFLMTAYIAAFGKSFLVVWQGTAFITGSRSDLVLTILVAAFLPRMLQSISMEFFYATRRLGFLLGIHGLEAGLKVGLCFLLARPYGLIGIAIANLIPSLLFQGLAIPLFLFRDFSFPPREYFREALLRPLAVGACAYLAGMGLVAWHAPWTWPFFLAEALLASVVGAAAAAWIGLQREELRRAVALIPGLRLG